MNMNTLIVIVIFVLLLWSISYLLQNYLLQNYLLQIETTNIIKKILFLDIDDTLLRSDNIFVYFKEFSSSEEIKLSPNDYKTFANLYNKNHFDFRDFDNPYLIRNSIINSVPLTHNFEFIRNHIVNGWDLGILTARGEENEIKKIIGIWLEQHLGIPFNLDYTHIHAVGDIHNKYPGETYSIKKLNVLIWYWNNSEYERIKLMDDSKQTIDEITSYLPHQFEYYHVTN